MEQELLALLKQREETVRRAERLRAELPALNERIAAAEEELSDLVVTEATLARVFAERDAGEPQFEQVAEQRPCPPA
jgi:DNA repair exonuclease SbcCD ATPase subunit